MYKDIWDMTKGEELENARESNSSTDCYAVMMKKDRETVGHISWAMSRMCTLFLEKWTTLLTIWQRFNWQRFRRLSLP